MIIIKDGILNIPECERFVGFTGDNNHTKKTFFIRSNPESGWLYRLYLTFDDGRHNFFTLPAAIGEEGTLLEWNIQEDHILKSGLVKAQIKAFSEDNEVYHTTSDVFLAGKTAEEDDEFKNSNSEFLNYEKILNELYRKMMSASAKMPYVGENGNWFYYDEKSESFIDSGVSSSVGVADNSITPEKLDRTYVEWQNRTTVNTYADLDNIIATDTNLNTAFTVMFTGLSPVKKVVGDGTFFAMKSATKNSLLLLNVDNGEIWSYTQGYNEVTRVSVNSEDLENLDSEATNLADGSIDRESLFSLDMAYKYLSLPMFNTSVSGNLTDAHYNSYTTPGIYQLSSQTGTRQVLIVLKPDSDAHLMQIRLSYDKIEYRGIWCSVGGVYADDDWEDWVDLTATKAGADGYTPIKGVDYFTEEDKAEFKAYIDESILNGSW